MYAYMKRFLSFLAVIGFVILNACQPEPYLSVSPDSLSFTESGGSQTVQISANYAWTASVSGSGFSVSPSSGEGNATVTVTASAASSPDEVSGTLTVKSEGLSAGVSLKQSAKPTLVLGNGTKVPASGGSVEIPIQYNTDYTVEVEPSAQSWIKFVKTKALSSGRLEFEISANEGDERSGKVTVKDNSGKASPVTVTITQEGETKVLVVGDVATVPAEGATVEVDVQYNVGYTVEVESSAQSWIHYVETRSVQSGKLVFKVDANDGEERTGKVTVKDNSGKVAPVTITIVQEAEPKVLVVGDVATIPYEGGTVEVDVQYNVDYTVEVESSAQSWIHYVMTKSVQSGKLVFKVDANDGGERAGMVTIKDNSGTVDPVTITFVQDSGFFPVTAISFDRTEVTAEVGEEITLNVIFEPENATNKELSWDSSDPNVTWIKSPGVIVCRAIGKSTITAYTGDLSATCDITVVEPSFVAKERAALEAFYRANNGDNWNRNDNWCSDRPLKEWYGVNTDYLGHVNRIYFWGNNLMGYIPKEIADLTELEYLQLNNNAVVPSEFKPLPEELGKLKKLKSLSLQGYTFDGKIPDFLFDNLPDLESLSFSNTFNTDPQPFPQGVTKLKKLQTLIINNAKLSGTLPAEIGYLYDLKTLILRGNDLEGTIPESFGNLKNLDDIDLSENHFSGVIPSSLRTMDNYWKLWPGIFYENDFSMEDLQASVCPAPRSPKLTAISGNTLDMEAEFKKNDYTVLAMVQWSEGELEFFKQLEQLRQANPGLGIVTYFDNNSDDPAERKKMDDEFKELLRKSGAGWESFIRYFTMNYPEGTAPFYWRLGTTIYPGGNNSVVVIGPDNTVVFTTLVLDNMMGNKHDEVIAYLEKALNSPIERYESSDYSADKKVKQLQKASVGNGVDLVITGDAFSDRLITDGTFESLARNAADNLFSVEPLKSLRNRFNVYLVNAVSRNEEYFNGCSTVFSGEFGYGSEVGGDNEKVLKYAREALSDDRMDNAMVLVMMNSSKSGGTCYMLQPVDMAVYAGGASIAWSPCSDPAAVFGQSGSATTMVHELGGHGLGKLADEYYYYGMGRVGSHMVESVRMLHERGWYVNVDFTDNPAEILWSRFIGDPAFADEGIGAYEGGFVYEYGVWRPTDRSLMFENFSNPYFNAPSRAQLYKRIMKLSEGPSWEFDYDTFVEWDKEHRQSGKAGSRSMVETGEEESAHSAPVMVGKTWREVVTGRR